MIWKSKTNLEYIKELSVTMQEIDKEGIRLLTGQTPLQGLLSSWHNSIESETWGIDNKVVAINGISKPTIFSEWACPWLVCSEDIRTCPRTFLEASRVWVEEKVQEHLILSNYVYTGHKRSIKWLKWLGFTLYPPEALGPYNALFMRNEKKWDKHL